MKDINKHNRLKFIAVVALSACIVVAGMMAVKIRRRPAKGIVVRPVGEWVCEKPVFYRQNDEEWKDDRMGAAMDPLDGDEEMISLEKFGNTVYSVRSIALHREE